MTMALALGRASAERLTKKASRKPCNAHVNVPVRRGSRTRQIVVAAAQQEETTVSGMAGAVLSSVKQSYDKFMQRYENSILSSGIGAMAVTGWCVAHGQAPATAAAITVASTITALVLNEVLFADEMSG